MKLVPGPTGQGRYPVRPVLRLLQQSRRLPGAADLRQRQPPTLIVWGRNDPVFDIAEVAALKRDLPKADVHVLDAGHFALDESAGEIAGLMRDFLGRLPHGGQKTTGPHI
jgi:pimeloyl-ACP methyl ester carboxylesterase